MRGKDVRVSSAIEDKSPKIELRGMYAWIWKMRLTIE